MTKNKYMFSVKNNSIFVIQLIGNKLKNNIFLCLTENIYIYIFINGFLIGNLYLVSVSQYNFTHPLYKAFLTKPP